MSEHEGPVVEAVKESESVVDAAPPSTSNEGVTEPNQEAADTAEPEVASPEAAPDQAVLDEVEQSSDSATIENAETSPVVEAQQEVAESAAEADAPVAEAAETPTAEAETPTAEAEAPATEATEQTASNEDVTAAKSDADQKQDNKTKVVRTIAVGQEITGTVKRLADFGAFVDIGVGRDGLLHVSELSVQRVNKVSDVLTQGQEVTVWIKELNREKNRISLTLISPDTKTIRDINKDDILEGTVTRMTNFGAFVDIGIGRDALLHVREMAEGFVKRPEDIVTIGETMEVRVIELNRRRGRVDLSIKGLRPEPESAEPEGGQGFADGEEEFVDEFENVEPMSAMELALKRAMEADGGDSRRAKSSRRKQRRNRDSGDEMDDIISRTLSNTDG